MGKRTKGPTPQRRQRMRTALKLREAGTAYAAIGEQLGVAPKTAWEDVQAALKEITREPAEELLTLELARLDELWKRSSVDLGRVAKAWKEHVNSEDGITATVAEKIVSANQKIFQTQLKIMERRARMTGLDSFTGTISVDVRQSINDAFDTLMATPAEAFTDED